MAKKESPVDPGAGADTAAAGDVEIVATIAIRRDHKTTPEGGRLTVPREEAERLVAAGSARLASDPPAEG